MGSQGLYEGQKFDVTHQACRLIALDDISVIRPKNFHPVARKMRGGHNVPPRPNRRSNTPCLIGLKSEEGLSFGFSTVALSIHD